MEGKCFATTSHNEAVFVCRVLARRYPNISFSVGSLDNTTVDKIFALANNGEELSAQTSEQIVNDIGVIQLAYRVKIEQSQPVL